jgi:hypothetical protein
MPTPLDLFKAALVTVFTTASNTWTLVAEGIATATANYVSAGGVIPDATTIAKGILKLAGQLGGTADSPTVTGVTETGGPTALAMGAVPDGQYLKRVGTTIAGDTLPDAAAATKGIIQLAGALGGTAASPKVVGFTETLGPTDLTFGTIADGEFLKRVAGTIVSAPAGGGGAAYFEYSDVTASIAAGGFLDLNIAGWFDKGIVFRIVFQALAATYRSAIEFTRDDTFTAGLELYKAGDMDCHTDRYYDNNGWWYTDEDVTQELHVRIHNHGTTASTYVLIVEGIGA